MALKTKIIFAYINIAYAVDLCCTLLNNLFFVAIARTGTVMVEVSTYTSTLFPIICSAGSKVFRMENGMHLFVIWV